MGKSLENVVDDGHYNQGLLRRIANSKVGRFLTSAALAGFLLYSSCDNGHHETKKHHYENPNPPTPPQPPQPPEEPCTSFGLYTGGSIINPNPTKGASEVYYEVPSYTMGNPILSSAWLLIDGKDKIMMEPADGAFDSGDEVLKANIPVSGYENKSFHSVELISENVKGCTSFSQLAFTLSVVGENVLVPAEWDLEQTLLRGNEVVHPDHTYLDFSWEGAAAFVDYDFKGGNVTFTIEAATATRNNPTEKAHLNLFVYDPAANSSVFVGGFDADQGGEATYPTWNGQFFNYILNTTLGAGPKQLIITSSGDTGNIDLYVRLVEITEKQIDAVEAWNRIYDSMYDDIPTSIATDPSGNVYVTGIRRDFVGDDFWTLKLDPQGNIIWDRIFNSGGKAEDQARAITVDKLGNVYVAGKSDNTGRIVKYDNDGNVALIKYCPEFMEIDGIKVDDNGNIYATGWFQNSSDNSIDGRTIKYDSAGNMLWSKTDDLGNYVDQFHDLALDLNGNAIVTGNSGPSNRYNMRTSKLDGSGNTLWDRILDNQGFFALGKSVAVDGNGSVFVTGETQKDTVLEDGWVYRVMKYDSSGNLLRDESYNTESVDYSQDLALDSSGNVYMTGYSMYFDTAYHWISTTIKYDNGLNMIWNKTFSGAPGVDDRAFSIAADSSGNAYVLGWTENGRDRDIRIIKYSEE